MEREARCQGVILKDDCILVLRQYNYKRKEEYWMLPGGELEQGESEEECVLREIKEETGLEVEIKEELFDEKENRRDEYKRYITFLCTPIEGSVEAPGSETVSHRKILDLIWVPINNEEEWNEYLLREQFFPSMNKIKDMLLERCYVALHHS